MNFVQKHSGQSHASNIPKDYFFIDLILDISFIEVLNE